MKTNRLIGMLFLILAIFTISGMAINKDVYWRIYNYATIILALSSGIILARQK